MMTEIRVRFQSFTEYLEHNCMEKRASENIYRKKLIRKPPRYTDSSGQKVMLAPASRKIKNKWDEECVVANIIANMKVFARWYSSLLSNLYLESGLHSGVMATMSVPIQKLTSGLSFPGDIDILTIPYENDCLIPSLAMVVEIKVLRAEKRRLGKSPNQFGFSQAFSLLQHGFPYVAVGHVIVTDDVRDEPHHEMLLARTDGQSSIASLETIVEDTFEVDLCNRTYGRLVSNAVDDSIGLFSMNFDGLRMFEALGKACKFNPQYDSGLLDGIQGFYEQNTDIFFEIPRYSDIEIEVWKSRLSNNPNVLTPWELSRRLFMNQWIRKIETLVVEVDGRQQLADIYHTDNNSYLYYRQ